MPRPILLCGILFFCAAAVRADQVVLQNGDRLTGEVARYEKETLVLRTEYAGDIRIQSKALSEIRSAGSVTVTLKDARVLVGRLEGTGQEWRVQTDSGISVVTVAEVAVLRSEKEQQAFLDQQGKVAQAGILDLWSGDVELGLSATRGNAKTTTISSSIKTQRISEKDRVQLYFTSLFARNRDDTGETITAANAIRGGGQYDRNLTRRIFVFGFADYAVDQLQDLDLRSVYGGGAGVQLFRSPAFSLETFAGASFNRENFSTGNDRSSGEALAGQDLSWKIARGIKLSERMVFYPNLTNTGEYRINFDSSLTGQLNRWLGWHFTLSDRFLSNPPVGSLRNDLLITTGLRLTFGEEREFRSVTGRGAIR